MPELSFSYLKLSFPEFQVAPGIENDRPVLGLKPKKVSQDIESIASLLDLFLIF